MVVKRNTWQREAVRAALADESGFVSAQQLHDRLRHSGSAIGLATVYRALASLVESEEADTLQSPEGENIYRFCQSSGHHHHLICRVCGHTEELEANEVETWAHQVAAQHGFTDTTHAVDVFGICANCRSNAG